MHFFETIGTNYGNINYLLLPPVVLLLILLALAFDYLNGLHDAANSIATIVSTRVLTPGQAVVWAAFFNFVAFLIFNLNVAATIGRGIIDPGIVTYSVIGGTLIGACAWNILTWYWGLPTSSSHALIGGLVGAGLAHTGWSALVWEGIGKTCLFILVAPLLGLVIGLAIAVCVYWILYWREARPQAVDWMFRRGQLVSAALYSLGHGGNDAQKTMGVILVLLIAAMSADKDLQWTNRFALTEDAFAKLTPDSKEDPPKDVPADAAKLLNVTPDKLPVDVASLLKVAPGKVPAEVRGRLMPLKDKYFASVNEFEAEVAKALATPGVLKPAVPYFDAKQKGLRETPELFLYRGAIVRAADHSHVPTEMVLACHLAMGLGTLMGGWRIVKTMGQRIIRLRPVDGFCAETGAAFTLVLTLFGGIPVSTTHTITGSLVGVGSIQRLSAVRWGVAGRVVWAWVFTIPGAAIVSALCVALFEWVTRWFA